jgi:ABC-type antimicrobial peptide transport system permease subunit
VDPDLPIHDVQTMRERSAQALAGERFGTTAITLFAALGLLLAVLGVYGIMAYSVVQRRREIGIRLALGAPRSAVLRHIMVEGGLLAATGLTIGIAAALVVTRALPTLMPSAGSADVGMYAVVAPLMLGVALLACGLPARAATRIDPMETITSD